MARIDKTILSRSSRWLRAPWSARVTRPGTTGMVTQAAKQH